jgi:serine/threonine protein phosphatase PrpC
LQPVAQSFHPDATAIGPVWRVFGTSVRGAAHERAGLPNQDALLWTPETPERPPIIVAVSDGHGSARCFRSDRGSRFAVDAAVQSLQRLLDGQPDLSNHSAVKRTAQEALPQDIVRTWDALVGDSLTAEPLTETELAGLEASGGARSRLAVEADPRTAYGATLLAVLVTDSFLLYVQLGDGDILAVPGSGEVERPVARDPRLFANETTSLSSDQAWTNVQVAFQALAGTPPALVLLSTDGYANSFRNEDEFRKVGPDLLSLLHSEGMEVVSQNLEGWLHEATQSGSGDDVTLAVLCRTDALYDSEGSTAANATVGDALATAPPESHSDTDNEFPQRSE